MVAYELNCLLSSRIPIDASVKLFRGLAQGVIRNGGVVHKVTNHGIRPLGYTIRKSQVATMTRMSATNYIFCQESHLNAQYIALEMDTAPKVRSALDSSAYLAK